MVAALGYSDNIIAGLLGHHINTITNRYTHLTEKVVVDAANVVSEKNRGIDRGVKKKMRG